MAGDWIKMRSNLDTDPHVITMACELGCDELRIVGMLWKVWSWADQHSLDGNAVSVTAVTLDRFTNCPGFADALRKVGWLEGRDGALTFPRFEQHNGQTAKNRALTKDRVAKKRNASTVTDVTHEALPEKRREEKRREEPKEEDLLSTSGEPKVDPPRPKKRAEATPYEWIYAAYAKLCPSLRQVRMRSGKRDAGCKRVWGRAIRYAKEKGGGEEQAKQFVSILFETAQQSPFLRGEKPGPGHEHWKADFEFVTGDSGIVNIMEGKYE